MKNLLCISLYSLIVLSFFSCYEESDWLGDNATFTGNSYPVISGFDMVNERDSLNVGDQVQLDLRYWSDDPIDVINLYVEYEDGEDVKESLVNTFSHTPNFQEDSQTDQLLMSYTVTDEMTGKTITFHAEIVNENGLTRNTKDSGTGNRPSISRPVR